VRKLKEVVPKKLQTHHLLRQIINIDSGNQVCVFKLTLDLITILGSVASAVIIKHFQTKEEFTFLIPEITGLLNEVTQLIIEFKHVC
jgi:hypothetical protein